MTSSGVAGTPSQSRRRYRRQLLGALALAVPLLVYASTMAPGLSWSHHGADGGDLVTAAYTLGVPHPPGYPAYTLLAWPFTRLPWGSVAWRVNLLSAASTAAAAALIYLTVVRLLDPADGVEADVPPGPSTLVAGLGAAWSYAFVPLVWGQALIAEVYALAGFWTALVLWLTRRRGAGNVGAAFGLGLVWSLGWGVHLTLVALAPVDVWALARRLASAPRNAAWGALGLLAGSLIWLYLPLRGGRGGVTWGRPATWDGFRWLVSGALYRGYLFALPLSALGARLAAWIEVWGSGLGVSGVGCAVWGVIHSLGHRRDANEGPSLRGWGLATGLSFLLLNLYAVGYNTTDSVVYLVPAFVIGSTWLGVGMGEIFHRARRWCTAHVRLRSMGSRWWVPAMLVVALATPAWTLARNGGTVDLSDDREAEHFALAVLAAAPSRAVLLTTTDRQTFTLWYYQRVQGLRPDVAVVDQGLWGFDWYLDGLRQAHPDLLVQGRDGGGATALTKARPHCQVQREARTGWLDCQN